MTSPRRNEDAVVAAVPTGLLIGDKWVDGSSGDTFPVRDPSTGLVLAHVAEAGVDEACWAMDVAAETQRGWAATPPRRRADVLRAAYELMMERLDDLALLVTLEMGKPLPEARAEVRYAADFLRWFAEEAVRLDGSWSVSPDGESRTWTMRQPVGPCLLVTPWNFPLAMGTRKLGPAFAAGCTAIVKPSEQAPLSMLALADIFIAAGLPEGVLGVLTTSHAAELVAAIMADPRLRKLSFTGSTAVGRKLIEQSANGVLRTSMELGGNAPFIVFNDADVDHAADEAVAAKLRNNGEACTAANRFLVQTSIAERFTAALVDRFASVVVGRGTEEGVTLGPLIDAAAVDKVTALVAEAVALGARVVFRGQTPPGDGSYCPPIVLDDVPLTARIAGEEIFGPVISIFTFDDEDEAIEVANATEYGLAAYLFTGDLDRAVRVAERLETGMIGLNRGMVSNVAAPFGGIKSSGFGREGSRHGIDEYVETKYVALHAPVRWLSSA